MKTTTIPTDYTHIAPDGSEIRELLENQYAGLAHCVLPAGNISSATRHQTVSEFWYVLAGTGHIWLKDIHGEQIIDLKPGLSIEVPSSTAFQFRSGKQTGNLITHSDTHP